MELGRKIKVKRLALVGVVLVLVVVTFLMLRDFLQRPPPPTLATAGQAQEAIADLKQCEAYKVGGVYIARLERSGVAFDSVPFSANSYQDYVISVRLMLDFLISISPDQIEMMTKEGGLRGASLSPDQRRLLSRLQRYRPNGIDITHSVFFFMRQHQGIVMLWKETGSRNNDSFGLLDASPDIRKTLDPKSRDVVNDILCRGRP